MSLHSITKAILVTVALLLSNLMFIHTSYASPSSGRIVKWTNIDPAPQVIQELKDIVDVDTGELHSIALKSDGTVWTWGNNQNGQLGNGTLQNTESPVQVRDPEGIDYLKDVIAIAAGYRFNLALKADGTVWTWGFNPSGARGTGDTINLNLLYPKRVLGNSQFINIIKVAAGGNHSLALTTNGTLFAWGHNNQGQIGTGCSTFNCSTIRAPTVILNGIIDIAAGELHSVAIMNNGTAMGWGRYVNGQIGISQNTNSSGYVVLPQLINGLNNLTMIKTKNHSNVALDSSGKIHVWGGFINPITNNFFPTELDYLDNIYAFSVGQVYDLQQIVVFVSKEDGTVWMWKSNTGPFLQLVGLSNIATVAVSKYFSHLAVEKYDPEPSPTPTPAPFLNLPVNNAALGKTFDEIALNPNSWFDHKYPHPYILCCIQKVLNYTGIEIDDYYRSHNGYDYGTKHGLGLKKPVLAAASGTATYLPNNGDLGNMIKIDHNNGYQTWYAHLDSSTLDFENNENVEVIAGQEIGKVGKSGNSPHAHLHFTVFKDSDEDGSFNNDYPFGLVDPLGWLGTSTDPWENYEVNGKKGSKSYNLFVEHHFQLDETVPDTGGVVNFQNLTVRVPSGAADSSLTIKIKKGPFEKKSNTVKSIAPSFFIDAYNTLSQNVKDFDEPVTLMYDYSDSDLSNIDEGTLKFYYRDEANNSWVELPTTINPNKTIVTITSHFTQFGVMGELIDTTSPITSVSLTGDEGQNNWFRSDVTLNLTGNDGEGIGVFDTIYSLDGENWDIFKDPILFATEGSHTISYMSYDKAGNEEEIKTITFYIDKTPPVVSLETNTSYIWPPDRRNVPVTIDGSIDEENLFLKTLVVNDEYNEFSPQTIDFGQTVNLKASRKGNDSDGRQYTVKLTAIDMAGNISEKVETIIVLHDQGI